MVFKTRKAHKKQGSDKGNRRDSHESWDGALLIPGTLDDNQTTSTPINSTTKHFIQESTFRSDSWDLVESTARAVLHSGVSHHVIRSAREVSR